MGKGAVKADQRGRDGSGKASGGECDGSVSPGKATGADHTSRRCVSHWEACV